MQISYNNKIFSSIKNSESGDVGAEKTFRYRQKGDLVWAEYEGGNVVFGALVAKCGKNGVLDMRYQHLNSVGELMTGVCISTPEILPDGRIRLHEKWRWTCGDLSKGSSVIEEIIGHTPP